MKCKTMIAGYFWMGEMHMDLFNSICADGDEGGGVLLPKTNHYCNLGIFRGRVINLETQHNF